MNRNLLFLLFLFPILVCNAQSIHTNLIGTVPSGIVNVYPHDFDNDGDEDIIATNGLDTIPFVVSHPVHPAYASKFILYENDGGMSFTQHNLSDISLTSRRPFSFGDLNNDAKSDFLYYENGNLKVRNNDGAHQFPIESTIIDLNSLYLPDDLNDCQMSANAVFRVERTQIGDINGDNLNDIIFITKGRLSIADPLSCTEGLCYGMLNNGTGFDAPQYLFTCMWDLVDPTGDLAFFNELSIDDKNLDGYNDILYSRVEGQYFDFYIHYGTSTGIDPTPTFIYDTGYFIDFFDMNGDSYQDAAMISGVDRMINGFNNIDASISNYWYHEYDYIGNLANGFILTDIDSDGLGDMVMVSDNAEVLHLIQNDLSTQIAEFDLYSIQTEMAGQVVQFVKMNADGIDDSDILCITDSNIYVLTNTIDTATQCALIPNAFIDVNSNGIFENGESQPVISPFTLDNGNDNITISTFSGGAGIYIDPGTYQWTYNDINPYVDPLFSTSQTITCNTTGDEIVLNLPFAIQTTPQVHFNINSGQSNVLCNDPVLIPSHYIVFHNDGNITANGEVSYTLDNHQQYISANPAPSSINGNVYHWIFNDIAVGEHRSISISVTPYDALDAGESVSNTLEFDFSDGGSATFNETIVRTQTIQCSFDPNMIVEETGYTELGYFAEGQELLYTIHFQNTGNAPAQTVSLHNTIPGYLDVSTLQIVSGSHPFTTYLNDNRELLIQFNDINLPDSASDPQGSMGNLSYRIRPIVGLNHGTEILNSASIVFDFNEPVVTNNCLNTKYDCSDLENIPSIDTEHCDATSTFQVSHQAEWIEDIMWSYNSNIVQTPNSDFFVGQGGTLGLVVSNSLCTHNSTWEILNHEITTPTFDVSGNSLFTEASGDLQWHLNGQPIVGATSANYEITQSGDYHLEVSNAFGCSASSATQSINYTSIAESTLESISLYPNPADQFITIVLPHSGKIVITDMTSRVIHEQYLTDKNNMLDISAFSSGNYLIRFEGKTILLQVI